MVCWEQTALTRDSGAPVVQGAKEFSTKMMPPVRMTAQGSPDLERGALNTLFSKGGHPFPRSHT